MEVNNFSRDINSVVLKNREGHCRWGIYYTRRGHTLTWVSNFDLSASNIKVLQSTLLSSQLLKIPIDFSHRHHHRDILGLGRVSLSCVFLTLRTMCTLLVLWFCSVPNYSYMGVKCRKISGALSRVREMWRVDKGYQPSLTHSFLPFRERPTYGGSCGLAIKGWGCEGQYGRE